MATDLKKAKKAKLATEKKTQKMLDYAVLKKIAIHIFRKTWILF
jgi:hypothetical protein